ncbi:hypothetical protein DPEC_G00265070 [Dallia pectoralis]|uniref:Uncharacterized protein n=1 Tax=Dallia pectoralis TaxID=75939 RepID=A0ACC2FST3_DALPE|nr:hypothetical protein DPEC_G00265070 [Dallia pectoralis]
MVPVANKAVTSLFVYKDHYVTGFCHWVLHITRGMDNHRTMGALNEIPKEKKTNHQGRKEPKRWLHKAEGHREEDQTQTEVYCTPYDWWEFQGISVWPPAA